MGLAAYVYDSQSDTARLTGGSWLSALPLTNLQDDRLDSIARSSNTSLGSTQFMIQLKMPVSIRHIYLGWTNLTADAKVRVSYWPDNSFTGSPDYDTGNQTGLIPDDEDADRGPSIYLFPPEAVAQFILIEIDDQLNPAGYIDIARLVIGRWYQPTFNYDYDGNGLSFVSKAVIVQSLAGDDVVFDKAEARSFVAKFGFLPETELYADTFAFLRKVKRGGEVIVIPDPGADAVTLQRRSFLGQASARDSLVQSFFQHGGTGLQIIEKLGLAPADIPATFILALEGGTFSLAGFAAILKAARIAGLSFGAFVLSGQDIGFRRAVLVSLARGLFTLTGKDVVFFSGKHFDLEFGSFTLTSFATRLLLGKSAPFTYGGFSLTGYDVGLTVRRLTMALGSFALTGQALAFQHGARLAMGFGDFALTMFDADLSSGIRLLMGDGSFVLTGQALSFARALTKALDYASFTLTGQSIGFAFGLPLASGAFTLSGQDVGLKAAKKVALAQGSVALTGQSIGLYRGFRHTLAFGSFTMTGQAVTLRNYSLRITTTGDRRTLAGDQAGNLRRTV